MRHFLLPVVTLAACALAPFASSLARPQAPPPVASAVQSAPRLVVQTGHTSSVTGLAVSPDGTRLLSASYDGTARLWDRASQRELRTIAAHAGGCYGAAWSPDGARFATVGHDKAVRVWDARTGEAVHALLGHTAFTYAVAWNQNEIYSAGWDGTVRVWNAQTGKETRQIAVAGESATGKARYVKTLALSPDGKTLATGTLSGNLRLWNAQTGAALVTIPDPHGKTGKTAGNSLARSEASVDFLTFNRGGSLLASSGDDKTVRVWETTTGKPVGALPTKAFTSAVAWSDESSRTLALSNGADEVLLWRVGAASGAPRLAVPSKVRLGAIAWKNGALFGMGQENLVTWENANAPERTPPQTTRGKGLRAVGVAFAPTGARLLALSDEALGIYDLEAGRRTGSRATPTFYTDFALSPNGELAAVGEGDETGLVSLINARTGAVVRANVARVAGGVNALAFSLDGTTLAVTGGVEGERFTVQLLRVSDGKEQRTLGPFSTPPRTLAWTNSQTLVIGETSGNLRLYNAATGAQTRAWKAGDGLLLSLAISPNSKTIATGNQRGVVRLWDATTGTQKGEALTGHGDIVYALAWNADNRRLAVGAEDRLVRVWDAQTGRVVQTLAGHSDAVRGVAWSPDGKRLASAGADGAVRLWDVPSETEIARLYNLKDNDWVATTPRGLFDGTPNAFAALHYVRDNRDVQGERPLPLESFFEQFYTPRVLAQAWAGTASPLPAPTVNLNNAAPPPLVAITSPSPNVTQNAAAVTVTVAVTDQGGGAEDVRMYQNGKLVGENGKLLVKVDSGERVVRQTFAVTLLPGDNVLRATAFNRDRTEAAPAQLTVRLTGASGGDDARTADLYIVAVGINTYKNPKYRLAYARPDAEALASIVEARGGGIFRTVRKTLVFDADATKNGIENALAQVAKVARPQDALLFYYSGHGVMSEGTRANPSAFFLACADLAQFTDDADLYAKGVEAARIRDLCLQIKAQKQLIILDACQSGGAVEAFATRGAPEEKAIAQLARSAGVMVLSASLPEQYATELTALQHGVFTFALLEGLRGKADGSPNDGKITVSELKAYVSEIVPLLSAKYGGEAQYPSGFVKGQDFPLSINKP